MSTGYDYSFAPHPTPKALVTSGAFFVCRYLSPIAANDANGKNLQAAELQALRAAGVSVVVVEEGAENAMLSGRTAGISDATHALAVTTALGMTGVPVYFACDFDATPAQQASINEYLDGAASVIGPQRVGIYGGYYPVSRAKAAGKAAWFWQAEAWSGGQWLPEIHIRQRAGTVTVGGCPVDHDDSMQADFGQWPRPSSAQPVENPVDNSSQFTVTVPAVSPDDSGNWVRTVQALAGPRRGHSLVVDGEFGPATLALVKGVQAAAKLTQTGVVDADTWKALLGG